MSLDNHTADGADGAADAGSADPLNHRCLNIADVRAVDAESGVVSPRRQDAANPVAVG